MGIFDFLKSGGENDFKTNDPVNPDLSRMKKGYFVNYDLKTFQVVGYAEYDWGEGYVSQEWELEDGDDKFFLEREKDDKIYWDLSREVDSDEIRKIYKYIETNDDPPEEITIENDTFLIEESGAGYFCRDGKRPGIECIMWFFANKGNNKSFSIYQWGEKDFSSYLGEPVDEYQFTEITPGGEDV